jgi:hypothetical protein
VTPREVLDATFPEAECVDSRAEFMVQSVRESHRLRMANNRVPLHTATPGFDAPVIEFEAAS